MEQPQCLFCAIAGGQVPSPKVYEDEQVIAVLDIKPATKGHTLVFPKKHYAFITELPYEEMAHIFNITRTLIPVLMKAMESQGANVLYSAGAVAGQRAPHFFFHIIPRSENDGVEIKWEAKQPSDEEFKSIQKKIIDTLAVLGGQKQEPSKPVEQPKPEPEKEPEELPEYQDIGDRPARYW